MSGSDARATNAYWGRNGLERRILDALAAAGKDVDALTIDDLAPADQFHGGGKGATGGARARGAPAHTGRPVRMSRHPGRPHRIVRAHRSRAYGTPRARRSGHPSR